jgi:hypothetical protein
MNMQPKQEKKGNTLNVLHWVVASWSATIYVFMRKNIGKRHPGVIGMMGIGWLMLWILYTRAEGLTFLIPLYMVGALLHQVGARKSEVHSRYIGDPTLARMIGFKNDAIARRVGEPLIAFVFGIGLIACGFDEGKYFAFGAGAMAISASIVDFQEQRRVEDTRDAMIEGRYYTQRARERNG